MADRGVALNGSVNPSRSQEVENFCRDAAQYVNSRFVSGMVSYGAQAGMVRTITIQVRDALGFAKTGRWLVAMYVALTAGGDPDATFTVALPTSGILIENLNDTGPNPAYLYLTDNTGKVVFDLTAPGAGTGFVQTIMQDKGLESPVPYA